MIVRESLSRFDLLNEDFLADNILNEKFDINLLTNKAQRLAVLASMFLMFLGGKAPELKKELDKNEIAKQPVISKMAAEDFLDRDKIFVGFDELLASYKEKEGKNQILSAESEGFIDAVNKIKPGRLSADNITRYDKYDSEILKAVDNLKAKGENPNADLIKSIMLIETGMNPTKNSLGFEGFPQTKEHIINGWKDKSGKFHPGINQRYNTNFSIKDMYNAEKAAEFIHYYLKTVEKSDYVKDLNDIIIAYNWGIGNLRAYKNGNKDLPKETADYVAMLSAMKDYFAT